MGARGGEAICDGGFVAIESLQQSGWMEPYKSIGLAWPVGWREATAGGARRSEVVSSWRCWVVGARCCNEQPSSLKGLKGRMGSKEWNALW